MTILCFVYNYFISAINFCPFKSLGKVQEKMFYIKVVRFFTERDMLQEQLIVYIEISLSIDTVYIFCFHNWFFKWRTDIVFERLHDAIIKELFYFSTDFLIKILDITHVCLFHSLSGDWILQNSYLLYLCILRHIIFMLSLSVFVLSFRSTI